MNWSLFETKFRLKRNVAFNSSISEVLKNFIYYSSKLCNIPNSKIILDSNILKIGTTIIDFDQIQTSVKISFLVNQNERVTLKLSKENVKELKKLNNEMHDVHNYSICLSLGKVSESILNAINKKFVSSLISFAVFSPFNQALFPFLTLKHDVVIIMPILKPWNGELKVSFQ